MKRSEVWTASGGKDYASKPRPVVIVQHEDFASTDSVTVCGLTTGVIDAPLFRLLVEPSAENELCEPCWLMADKLMTMPRAKLGKPIGRPSDADMLRLNRALLVFLGFAGSSRR